MGRTQIGSDLIKDQGVTNIDIQDNSLTVSKFAVSGGAFDLSNISLTNLGSPQSSSDAVTKAYVDALNNNYWQKPINDIVSNLPSNPNIGDRYLINAGTEINKIAEWNGSQWVLSTPQPDWCVINKVDDKLYIYDSDSANTFKWIQFSGMGSSSLIFQGDSKVEVIDTGDGYISFTEDNTEVMRITGGNVGIGTINPGSKLHIYNGQLKVSDSSPSVSMMYSNGFAFSYNSTTGSLLFDSSGLSIGSGNNMVLGTNGDSNQLYLKNDGKIGVGTNNPSERLHVIGAIQQDLPSTNPSYIGTVVSGTAGENLSAGQVCRIGSDGKYYLASALSETTMPVIVLAVQDISTNSTGKFLVNGQWKNTSLSLTVGGYIYVSTTAGSITQTAPSVSGNVVQIIGVADSSTSFIYNSNITTVILA